MRKPILFLLLLSLTMVSLSQSVKVDSVIIEKFCRFSNSDKDDGPGTEKIDCSSRISIRYEELTSTDTLMKTLQKVLDLNGLHAQNLRVGTISNRSISAIYCKPNQDLIPRLIINKKYVSNYWLAIGILFHELGHLLDHHENLCSSPVLESDADLFAGRCFAVIHATKEEALTCLETIPDEMAVDHQYPAKSERKKQILKGYQNFLTNSSILSFTSINPRIRWEKKDDSVYIYIDDKIIAIPNFKGWSKFPGGAIDPKLGILYVEDLSATYRLYNFEESARGIGQLVNDRTSMTYMRFGKNSYRFYDKSKIVKRTEVKDDIEEGNAWDYEIRYRELGQPFKTIVFVDYFYAPNDMLLPAFLK